MGGAHLQSVNYHYAKFEYKGLDTVKVQITQTRHPLSISDGNKKCHKHVTNAPKGIGLALDTFEES